MFHADPAWVATEAHMGTKGGGVVFWHRIRFQKVLSPSFRPGQQATDWPGEQPTEAGPGEGWVRWEEARVLPPRPSS